MIGLRSLQSAELTQSLTQMPEDKRFYMQSSYHRHSIQEHAKVPSDISWSKAEIRLGVYLPS